MIPLLHLLLLSHCSARLRSSGCSHKDQCFDYIVKWEPGLFIPRPGQCGGPGGRISSAREARKLRWNQTDGVGGSTVCLLTTSSCGPSIPPAVSNKPRVASHCQQFLNRTKTPSCSSGCCRVADCKRGLIQSESQSVGGQLAPLVLMWKGWEEGGSLVRPVHGSCTCEE